MTHLKSPLNSRLFGNTLIYGITNAIYSGLPLILLPFLIKVLEPEDYGVVDLFRSICMVLVPVLGLSGVQSIGRFYYDLNAIEFRKLVSSIQIFQFGTSLLGLLIITVCSPLIEPKYVSLLYLCVAYFFFGQIEESLLSIYRVKERAKRYLIIRVLKICIELGLLYFLFVSLNNFDWTLRIYPAVLANVSIGLIAIVLLYKTGFRFIISITQLKAALIYSTPLILHMVSGYILNIGDRFFIRHYLGEEDLGNYAVAYQVGMAINFFFTSFNLAWTPTFFKWMKTKQIHKIKLVRNGIYLFVPILGILVLVVWYFVSPVLLTSNNYDVSLHIVSVILISHIILSLYKYEANYFLYSKRTKTLSFYTMTSAVVAIILNFLLVPWWGILGSAYATLFSFLLIYILVLFRK